MDLITVARQANLKFETRVRGHAVTSDLSVKDGGEDGGLAPAELLAASLGACMATMVQAYCQRHGWNGDAGACLTIELADNPKRIERIVVDLELPDGVPEDKKETVRRAAEGCPIHQTLKNPPAVDVDVA